jgi:hypothetical protein
MQKQDFTNCAFIATLIFFVIWSSTVVVNSLDPILVIIFIAVFTAVGILTSYMIIRTLSRNDILTLGGHFSSLKWRHDPFRLINLSRNEHARDGKENSTCEVSITWHHHQGYPFSITWHSQKNTTPGFDVDNRKELSEPVSKIDEQNKPTRTILQEDAESATTSLN